MSDGGGTGRRPLEVGLQLPEAEREVRWTELAEMARLAEAVGFDALWVGDHLLYRGRGPEATGPWEAWSVLAALAAVTERVAIGPLVAATAFHAPAMLAKKAATVDEISGGRLILGLGAGWNEVEFRAFGFPFDHRVARFEEAFTIVRTLLTDGAVDFDGRFHQVRDCELRPRPSRPGGPPLLVGSTGPRMLRVTLPFVRYWNAWYDATANSPRGVAPLRDLVDGVCREVGREPSEVRRTVAVLVALEGAQGRVHGDGERTPALSGHPEVMAQELRRYAAEGIGHVQLVLDPITLPSIARMADVLTELDRR